MAVVSSCVVVVSSCSQVTSYVVVDSSFGLWFCGCGQFLN